jgi:hypothetical protein
MPIELKRINQEKVTPIKFDNVNKKPSKDANICSEIYSNIFICSKKKSGKTVLIYNMIKKCIDKDTKVIIFASTLFKDASYLKITEFLEKNEISWTGHTSLIEDGVNKLDELVNELQEQGKDEMEKLKKPKNKEKTFADLIMGDSSDDEDDEKPRKKKYQTPEYLIILDDLSTELKNPALISLLKKNRHFKSRIIVSSQYLNDVSPQARRQIDLLILFGNLPEKKLKEVYKDFDISATYEEFIKMYKNSTKDKFNFLYLDLNNNDFRKNLNLKYEIK